MKCKANRKMRELTSSGPGRGPPQKYAGARELKGRREGREENDGKNENQYFWDLECAPMKSSWV